MELSEEQKKNKASDSRKIVLFKLGEEEFGLDIKKVLEIIKVPQYTKIPSSEAYIEGVINLRGKIIGVANISKKLGFPVKPDDDNSRIIVTEIGDDNIGLRVDMVKEVISIDNDEIKPAPPIISKKMNTKFIEGIIIREENLIIIVDVDTIISSSDIMNLSSVIKDANKADERNVEDDSEGGSGDEQKEQSQEDSGWQSQPAQDGLHEPQDTPKDSAADAGQQTQQAEQQAADEQDASQQKSTAGEEIQSQQASAPAQEQAGEQAGQQEQPQAQEQTAQEKQPEQPQTQNQEGEQPSESAQPQAEGQPEQQPKEGGEEQKES